MSGSLPSYTSGNTTIGMTHIGGSGNNNGATVSVGGQISQQITPNTSVQIGGNVTHSQSFHGHGGQTTGGVSVGISTRF
jgi:hypothetical protein